MYLRKTIVVLIASLIAGLAAACAMVESSLIEDGYAGECRSAVGFYYLPKTHLIVDVVRKTKTDAKAKTTEATSHEIKVKRVRRADRERGYCLDYLSNISADDQLVVKKYKAQPLLGLVRSNATDRSLEIGEKLIHTIFTAVSGNPDFQLSGQAQPRGFIENAGATAAKILTIEYDPFDPARSALINHALRDFGFCMILENYTIDLNQARIQQYCDNPAKTFQRHPVAAYSYKDVPSDHQQASAASGRRSASALGATNIVQGLYYRPRISYRLYIFIKRNLQAHGNWELAASHSLLMGNIAPILSIGVDRTAFAQRKTTLVFDEGMLKDACHFKGSELVGAVKLPLTIAKAVVSLPAQIIQVRIDQTHGMKELIKAQNEAIKTQTKYLAELNKLDTEVGSAGSPTSANVRRYKNFVPDPRLTTGHKNDDDLGTNWKAVCNPETAPGSKQTLNLGEPAAEVLPPQD